MALSDFLIASKMSESRRDINAYSKKAGRAMGKQGRWAGFGRMLGSIGAPLAAAAMLGGPIGWAGAALVTGVGSYLGGKWGREGAAKTKEGKVGKMKGGPSAWMQGSRETIKSDVADMRQYLKDSNITESVKAGAMAGIKVAGSDLTDALKVKLGGPALSGTTTAVPDVDPSQHSGTLRSGGSLSGATAQTASGTVTPQSIANVSAPATSAPVKPSIFSKEAMWGKGIQEGSPMASLQAGFGKGTNMLDDWKGQFSGWAKQDLSGGSVRDMFGSAKGTLEDVWKGGTRDDSWWHTRNPWQQDVFRQKAAQSPGILPGGGMPSPW
jgi:hypothetical protein